MLSSTHFIMQGVTCLLLQFQLLVSKKHSKFFFSLVALYMPLKILIQACDFVHAKYVNMDDSRL